MLFFIRIRKSNRIFCNFRSRIGMKIISSKSEIVGKESTNLAVENVGKFCILVPGSDFFNILTNCSMMKILYFSTILQLYHSISPLYTKKNISRNYLQFYLFRQKSVLAKRLLFFLLEHLPIIHLL